MIDFGGLKLKNPVVIASGPVSATIEQLEAAARAGAAGASIKQVMTRQAFRGNLRAYSVPENIMLFPIDKRLDVQEGLDLVREAKKRKLDMAIIVNLSSQEPDIEEYGRLAKRFEDEGADAIEINLCCPNFSLGKRQLGKEITADDIETGAVTGQNPKLSAAITKCVKEYVKIPVIPKLTPTALDPGYIAEECEKAGADGFSLVGGPSLGAPPVDIYNGGRPVIPLMERAAFGALTGTGIRYATYKITGQVYQRVKAPLMSSGGIDTWRHAVEMMMWGATSVSLCTAIMWRGWEVITKINEGIEKFCAEQGYSSVEDLIGLSLKYLSTTDDLGLKPGCAVVDPARCNGCGLCLKPGHCDAVEMRDGKAFVQPEKCLGCSICASLCVRKAITMQETAAAIKSVDGQNSR
ncbi:MAG: hypothetical protein ACM3RP_00355 [Chitinophagales bacterium]